ncbi:MAG TPA: PAS domain S-box protein [Polyangiaceae bacterium]
MDPTTGATGTAPDQAGSEPFVVHPLLDQQLRSSGADPRTAPRSNAAWRELLLSISQVYLDADHQRGVLRDAILLSSREMQDLNGHLARERDRLSVTITSMANGVCVLGADGRIEIANPAAESLLDAVPGQLLGRDLGDVVSGYWPAEQERRTPLRQLRTAIASGGSCRYDDARFMTLTRQWLPVSFALTPLDAKRSVGGFVIIFNDVRARKQAESDLRESESRFRAIFESAAVGIVRLGLDGRIADCNRTFSEMLGRSHDDLLGHGITACLHPDDPGASGGTNDAPGVAGVPGAQEERRYLHRDGSTVWVKQAKSFVCDSSGAPIFSIQVVENVTARKDLEMSLQQAQKLEAIGQLASGIAHEINTPVQFVSDSVHFVRDSIAELFQVLRAHHVLFDAAAPAFPTAAANIEETEAAADLPYLVEQLPKAVERALEGLQRVATIVRGMKAFGHPDQKEKREADLNDALEATLAIARNEYKYVATIEKDFGRLLPVKCHIGQLNQVFLNVIVNASHAIADVVRGTDAKGCIGVKTWQKDDSVFIAISDTGGGIPDAIHHRIFDPFFTTKEVGRGTGQGLAIARSVVVDTHKGSLTFQTQMGRGTTFTIRLPTDAPRLSTELP